MKSELTSIRIEEPVPYDLPVMKLTATHDWVSPEGQKLLVRAIYVYWFVWTDQLSADHDQRILLMGLDMLKTGVLKRWAYVSCLGYAFPGQEEAVYERLKGLITASVPQFQLVFRPPGWPRSDDLWFHTTRFSARMRLHCLLCGRFVRHLMFYAASR